jgi:G6PDH family F420-dependent oxidoreductase
MTEIGYLLASEEHDGTTLVQQAIQAEEAGFRRVWISDHYHPWIDRQGQSPFVWSVIGGIATATGLRLATAVTCPTYRLHPAVVAQAAATTAAMMPGRFTLGVGTGEALNEHILGDHWPPTAVRQDRLREAIDLMRALWEGTRVDWDGGHFTVEGARIYTRPDEPIPVLVSALAPKAMELVISHGDGWVTTSPDTELLAEFRRHGRGPAAASVKVCWGPDEAAARRLAHELWPNSALPGELGRELPMPAHFAQASQLVTEDQVAEIFACGPDPERHLAALRPYLDAGFDELYIQQIGLDTPGFLDFFTRELRPRLDP